MDVSLRGSRDSLREKAGNLLLGRRDSYVSANMHSSSRPDFNYYYRHSPSLSPSPSVASSSSAAAAAAASAAVSSSVRSSNLSQVHKMSRTSKLSKNEVCSLCQKVISTFFAQIYKCNACHLVFHAKCAQQGVSHAQVRPLTIA